MGTSSVEVIVPPGLPSPDPNVPLTLWIGKPMKRGELPPATITIDRVTYAATLVRDPSLDEN